MERRGAQDAADGVERHLAQLRRDVMSCCIPDRVEHELLARLQAAEKAVAAHDARAVVRHVELFVVALRRHMGIALTNRTAARWAGVALFDVQRHYGDPGQLYVETREFAEALELAGGTGEDWFGPRLRPQPPGAERVAEEMTEIIRACELPEDVASRLVELTGQMAGLGPAATTRAEAMRFFALASEFDVALASVQGGFISTTQANFLRGRIFYAFCLTLVDVIVQIAAVVVVVALFAGVRVQFRDAATKNRMRTTETAIAPCTTKKADLEQEVDDALDGLDVDQLRDLRDGMTKVIDEGTFRIPRMKDKWRWARARVEARIAQLEKPN